MAHVAAVVVTWNRRDLLRKCLHALRAQDRPADEVIVVDNKSDDDTLQVLATEFPDVTVVALDRNTGGAGGFAAGLRRALEGRADWLWILDDDTIPEPGALGALLDAVPRCPEPPVLLCSKVLWTDGTLHPMNQAWPRWTREQGALDAVAAGLVEVRAATYVSILVERRALEARGLPREKYFIWGDDVEFTARLLRHAPGYYVPESVVLHETKTDYSPARSTGDRYAYDVRNKIWMLRSRDVWTVWEKLWWASLGLKQAVEHLRFNRWRAPAWRNLLNGARAGLREQP